MISFSVYFYFMKNKDLIIVFDGFCILCNNYVRWISKRNLSKNIFFTNFDSQFIKKNYPNLKLGDTIFVITHKNQILKRSEAIKYCLKSVSLNENLKFLINKSPNFVLDYLYRLIASNRYRLFGKSEVCSIPDDIDIEKILY